MAAELPVVEIVAAQQVVEVVEVAAELPVVEIVAAQQVVEMAALQPVVEIASSKQATLCSLLFALCSFFFAQNPLGLR